MRTLLPAPRMATSLLECSARRSWTTAQHRRLELKIHSRPAEEREGEGGW